MNLRFMSLLCILKTRFSSRFVFTFFLIYNSLMLWSGNFQFVLAREGPLGTDEEGDGHCVDWRPEQSGFE